ncbi:PREDICTED: uncharacterized protein LOC109164039 [Ipomoea nil]|uniref:uncharacterized protein LOC109164039 n=1 Tax=Ipomoea nil TaxID=35883 RepID=UPI00090108EB|nr:PREDICTED: uncharacterized protein LOC109164039 [Ipomoea nil]
MPQYLSGAKVIGLIDHDTGTWDPHILADIFQPSDIPRIQSIPIAPEYDDIWYWYGNPNGCYSVKSGYRHIVGSYENNSNGIFNEWLTLWKLKIPPKWKTFLWRAICDILPTTNNLLIKRVDVNPMCAMCGNVNEDTMHALVLCDYAHSIWAKSNLPIPNIVTNIFHDWFSAILNVLDFDGIVYAAAILYHLWRARNGAVWDACLPRPTKLLSVATATMKAWKDIHHRVPPSQPRTASHHLTAEQQPLPPLGPNAEPAGNGLPPPHAATLESVIGEMMTSVKCYMDASYHRGTNVAAVGAVLLDANGHYISAFSAPLTGCHSPLMAETLACKEVLPWLKRRNELSIQIHTDCQQLQCYLTGPPATLRSHLGYAIDSCRTYMSTFNYCSVLYIPRLQNLLAHTLATSALSFNTAMYWDNVPPDSILTLL